MFNIQKPLIILFCGLLVCASPAACADHAELTTLEALVKQWVGLRSQIAEEQQNWSQQQLQWQQEIALLEKEQQLLDNAIAEANQFDADKESQTAEQLARQTALEHVQKQVTPILDRTVAAIGNMLTSIPPTLLSAEFMMTYQALNSPNTENRPANRLQVLTRLLSEIEVLQNESHSAHELITLNGKQRREMDVVYLGLARGFAVSPDNATAAIGKPTSTGWTWIEQPAIAHDVRKLVRILNAEAPPSLVALPMHTNVNEVQP